MFFGFVILFNAYQSKSFVIVLTGFDLDFPLAEGKSLDNAIVGCGVFVSGSQNRRD